MNEKTSSVKRMNTSMPPDIARALRLLAQRRGHNNVSRLIQDWTVDEVERVFGENWRELVNAADERDAA